MTTPQRSTRHSFHCLAILLIATLLSSQASGSASSGSTGSSASSGISAWTGSIYSNLSIDKVKGCLAIAAAAIALPISYYNLRSIKWQYDEQTADCQRMRKKQHIANLSLRIEVEQKCRELTRTQIQRRIERGDYDDLTSDEITRKESQLLKRNLRRELANINLRYESDFEEE